MHRASRAIRLVRLPLLSAMLAVCTGLSLSSPAAEDAPATRSYADGPLTVDDFRAEPPADSGKLLAVTTTHLTFRIQHRYVVNNRRATAYLTEITIDAVVMPDRSWSKRPADKQLLDHEQGHFDLTMIEALRARLHFAQRGKLTKLTATGATSEEAVASLGTKVEREMRKFFDELFAIQQEYERATMHGTVRDVQAEHRGQQRATLQELAERLKKSRKGR
jgi:hypothetical protein